MRRIWLWAALGLAALFAGCSRDAAAGSRALVFASASLAGAMAELAESFAAANPGMAVDVHTAGTPQLVLQIREGAPVDVVASADRHSMAALREAGFVGDEAVFARNSLAIVTPRGNPQGIASIQDLSRTDLQVLLCGPNVPAGRYGRAALARAGVEVRSVSDEPSVKAVVSKVALGEADAGIVYRTDVLAAAERVTSIPVAPGLGIEAEYPIALATAPQQRRTAVAFLAHLHSDIGARILRAHGFQVP